MNLISKAAFSHQATCEHITLVPGRCLASKNLDNNQQFDFVNIHNFNLNASQTRVVHNFLVEQAGMADSNPFGRAFVVCGDFNLRFDKPSVDLNSGIALEKQPRHNKQALKLISSLNLFTRIEHDQHSHYNASLNQLTDIDHIFVSMPGWKQICSSVQVRVESPEKLFAKGLSDHGPVSCALSPGKPPSDNDPIPPWVAKLPSFHQYLQLLVNASRLQDLLPAHALGYYKILIREAARLARNDHNNGFRDSPKTYLPNLVLIARLIVNNRSRLAKKLCLDHFFFSSRIMIVGGLVSLRNPVEFAAEISSAKRFHFIQLIKNETSKPKDKINSSKLSMQLRLSRLWKSTAPVNSLAAVTCEDGRVTSSEQDTHAELGLVWGRTLSRASPLPPRGHSVSSNLG